MISAEIAVSGYILPPPELPQIPPRVEIRSDQLRDLARLAKSVAEARESLEEQNEKFESLFQLLDKRADLDPDEIERIADSIMAAGQVSAPNIIAALSQINEHAMTLRKSNDPYLNGPILRSAEEAIDIGTTWLDLYQDWYIRVMKLASDRRAGMERGSPVFSDSSTAESYLRNILAE
jgi:hypothetical protein